jgi:hypothetical protein
MLTIKNGLELLRARYKSEQHRLPFNGCATSNNGSQVTILVLNHMKQVHVTNYGIIMGVCLCVHLPGHCLANSFAISVRKSVRAIFYERRRVKGYFFYIRFPKTFTYALFTLGPRIF